MTNSEDTGLATRNRNSNGIIPRTLDEVARMAKMAHASGLARVASPEAAGVILLTGAELGLSPMQSLRGIYVIDGKPVLSADLMVAVVKRSDVCVYWRTVESTDTSCTVETQRDREPAPARKTWTRADAERAGLLGKKPWQQYPSDMLRHRAAAALAREVYPDLLLGLYTPDEIEPIADAPGEAITEIDAPAQEPPQRPTNPLDGLGIEAPASRPQNAAETPAPADVAQPVAAPPKPADITDAQAEFLDGFYARVAEIELPGECVAVWLKHRVDVSTLPARERENSWKAIVSRCEEVGKMRNAKLWLKKAIASEDERRNEERAAQTDAPAASEVQP